MVQSPAVRGPRPIPEPGPHIAIPFGKYLLIKRLAVGGMAELFLAQDEPDAPLVVIKRILPYLNSEPEFVRMFLDEARIAAQLHHPNIVQVQELGKLEDSIFIAMEYVEGIDLRKMLQQEQKGGGAIDCAIAARIVAEVCAGLHYAHHCTGVDGRKMEIVHRDISPQNVMVGFDGRVKLVDFGIARANAFMERSKPGVLKGKFLYLSPEQVAQETLDHRSDLFAIGTLLYEITTGRSPFQRPTPEAVIVAVRREDPPAPQRLRADYPPELAAIVARCLAKDRNQRYQDASDIRADLEAYLRHVRPVGAPEVAEYAQLLFGNEDERTVLNIPTLKGSSQATLIAPPVLAELPVRKQEPRPTPPPSPEPVASGVSLGSHDATPLFTPRPPLDSGATTQPGRGPRPKPNPPVDERDTAELSLPRPVGPNANDGAPGHRATGEGAVLGAPPPQERILPPAPRRPTRFPESGGASPVERGREDLAASGPLEPAGVLTQAVSRGRFVLTRFLLVVAAVGLVGLGIGIGRVQDRSSEGTPLLGPPPTPSAGAAPKSPSAPVPENPASPELRSGAARVVFQLSGGAEVDWRGQLVRSGAPLAVDPGRIRYRVHCPGHPPIEAAADALPKSPEPQVISIRCPSNSAK